MSNSSKNNIVGKAEAMQDVFKAIGKISKTDITVLIRGEDAELVRELIAQSVHTNGHSSDKPFVAINVAAIPHELLESELFGRKKAHLQVHNLRELEGLNRQSVEHCFLMKLVTCTPNYKRDC